jgi:hypothetical protein
MTSDVMPVANPPLGKRLFKEAPAWTALPTLLVILGLLLALPAGWAILMRGGWREPALILGTVLGIGLACLGIHLEYVRVTIHEHGVLRRTVLNRRELLFADVVAVQQWGAKIRLLPAEGGRPFPLRQSREAEDLRDRLAMGFEEQLLRQLEEQGEVQWTGNVRLSRAGIRWSGSDGESLLPLSSSLRITIDPSYCRVYHPHRDLVPTLALSDAGFFPGLLLLQRLMKEAPPAEPRPEPARTQGLGEAVAEIRSRWVAPLAVLLICLGMGGRDALAWIEHGDPGSLFLWCLLSWFTLQTLLLHGRIEGHENGLSIRPRLGRRREILFSEIRSLRSAKRFSWFGESTTLEMVDERDRVVRVDVLTRTHAPSPALLRDRIAETVADSLLARRNAEGEIPWNGVRLNREWLHTGHNAGTERAIPISRDLRFTSDGRWLRLYQSDSLEPVALLDPSLPNLYPGLLVLQQLIEEAEQRTGAGTNQRS